MSTSSIIMPGQMPVAPGTNPDQGFFDDLNSEVGDKGFLLSTAD